MTDPVLPFFDAELRYLRELAARDPEIAETFGITNTGVADPFVQQLFQGTAFLAARVRGKLDDMFPELSEVMLNALQPSLIAPLPGMAMAQFTPADDLDAPLVIEKGAELNAPAVDGKVWTFRTGADVCLLPIALSESSILLPPAPIPNHPKIDKTRSALQLKLRTKTADVRFDALQQKPIRAHISADRALAFKLHELIFNHISGVSVLRGNGDVAQFLPASALQDVGFDAGSLMTPMPAHMPHHFASLTEAMTFPDKHLGFDVQGIDWSQLGDDREASLILHFDEAVPDLDRQIKADTFRLFCVPIINLFSARAEPFRYDAAYPEHRLEPRFGQDEAHEPYAVDRVMVEPPVGQGEVRQYVPVLSVDTADDATGLYQTVRRPRPGGKGDDVYLLLSADMTQPIAGRGIQSSTVVSDVIWMNRNIHEAASTLLGKRLDLTEANAGVTGVTCCTIPTSVQRPPRSHDAHWKLVAQMSLNHLSVGDGQERAKVLRELVSLHDRRNDTVNRNLIERLKTVELQSTSTRLPGGGRLAFCSGVDAMISIDDTRFSGQGGFFLGALLSHFLAAYSPVNSFVRVSARLDTERMPYVQWPARTGSRNLI
ncbi:MAG: type VI secretion system baseplate subunit TssF [Pseudomonadota bacterium]